MCGSLAERYVIWRGLRDNHEYTARETMWKKTKISMVWCIFYVHSRKIVAVLRQMF